MNTRLRYLVFFGRYNLVQRIFCPSCKYMCVTLYALHVYEFRPINPIQPDPYPARSSESTETAYEI